ncbi:MAG: glycosyltransferase family 4 protein [Bdellovibrionota bacterium]
MSRSDRAHRILYLVPQPFFVDRGAPFRVRATAQALAQIGAEVDLCVFAPGKAVEIPGVTVIRTWRIPGLRRVPAGPSLSKAAYDVLLFLLALKQVLTKRYTLIHGVEEGGFMAAVLGRARRIPFVFEMYSSMPAEMRKLRSRPLRSLAQVFCQLESFTIRCASGLISVSGRDASRLQSIYPDLPMVMLEGVPIGAYSAPSEAEIHALREKLSLQGKRVILYTGSSAQHQGVDLLLRSFAGYLRDSDREESRNIVLLIVGGAEIDNERWIRYRQLALNLNIEDRVFITGQRPGEGMNSYLSISELVVSPRLEGREVSTKICTYMASGVPILATALECHTRWLDCDTAFLAEPTLSAFQRGLERALDRSCGSRVERERLSSNARMRAERNFNGSELVETLRSLHRQLNANAYSPIRPAGSFSGDVFEDDESLSVKRRALIEWSAVGLLYLALFQLWWQMVAEGVDLF